MPQYRQAKLVRMTGPLATLKYPRDTQEGFSVNLFKRWAELHVASDAVTQRSDESRCCQQNMLLLVLRDS